VTLSPHPLLHPIFETLGDTLAYLLYRRSRIHAADMLEDEQHWLVIAVAAIGALVGSRILGLLEQVSRLDLNWHTLLLPGGRTTVGGLLGAWIAVRLVRRLRDLYGRTADLFAVPLCLGIGVGRMGCFLAGPADGTYGVATSLPWGVDFGDGILRHPTQLYEILFLIALASILHRYNQKPHPEGATFRLFLAAYLGWRLLIDFIKPQPLIYGLNLIQWACVAGLVALLPDLVRLCFIQPAAIRSTE
jgi:phosphatidylglycerol---prolipoprotein diacylglyceryl transferase